MVAPQYLFKGVIKENYFMKAFKTIMSSNKRNTELGNSTNSPGNEFLFADYEQFEWL